MRRKFLMDKHAKGSNTTNRPRQDNDLLLWSFFIGACLIAVAVVIAISVTTQQTAPVGSVTSGTPQGSTVRTIAFGKPNILDTDKDHALVSSIKGSLPASITQVTVRSDENCAPDSQGISHCLNRLSYTGGEITVRHTHKMADVPCLQPGEVLQVKRG
jgi:hypothetical protein